MVSQTRGCESRLGKRSIRDIVGSHSNAVRGKQPASTPHSRRQITPSQDDEEYI
jgi:hypothetical protein